MGVVAGIVVIATILAEKENANRIGAGGARLARDMAYETGHDTPTHAFRRLRTVSA
jgi:hypothetical protein